MQHTWTLAQQESMNDCNMFNRQRVEDQRKRPARQNIQQRDDNKKPTDDLICRLFMANPNQCNQPTAAANAAAIVSSTVCTLPICVLCWCCSSLRLNLPGNNMARELSFEVLGVGHTDDVVVLLRDGAVAVLPLREIHCPSQTEIAHLHAAVLIY